MKYRIATLAVLIGLVGSSHAIAQTRESSAPGPGVVEATIIPGGATFFTEGKDTQGPSFGNYDLGGSVTVNFNRHVGVEGEVSAALGITQTLDFTGGSLGDVQTPHLLNYSGNVIVNAGRGSVVPYVTGGVGGMTYQTRGRFALLLSSIVLAVGVVVAQQPAPPPIPAAVLAAKLEDLVPVDPLITIGTLPNGFRYYIRENHLPQARAELRLAVNAGSVLEDDDQRGLAHFVEHMIFGWWLLRFSKRNIQTVEDAYSEYLASAVGRAVAIVLAAALVSSMAFAQTPGSRASVGAAPPADANGFKVGDTVEISTGFGWMKATILSTNGNNYRVRSQVGIELTKTYPSEVRRIGVPTTKDRAAGIYNLHDRVQVNVQGRWETGEIMPQIACAI